jgi:hypothetical protein
MLGIICVITTTVHTHRSKPMDRGLRKRQAARAAVALLEWRKTRMTREDADREIAQARHELMLMEMRLAVEEFWKPRAAQPRHLSIVARGDIPAASNASHYS